MNFGASLRLRTTTAANPAIVSKSTVHKDTVHKDTLHKDTVHKSTVHENTVPAISAFFQKNYAT